MNLLRALRLVPVAESRAGAGHFVIALVGAGGKTTALFQLARQLQSPTVNRQSSIVNRQSSIILTATSHLGVWQIPLADRHLIAKSTHDLDTLPADGLTLVTGPLDGDRTRPLAPGLVEQLRATCHARDCPLLIEADGSRRLPLKAPAAHEPPIPACADLVIVVAGLTGLGQALDEDFVHRPHIFSELSGLPPGREITVEALAHVLAHPQGGLKNIPRAARRVVLLTQAESPALQSQGGRLAQLLLPAFDSILVGSLHTAAFQTFERVAGVILAAGASTRFGRPKQLLDWHGMPFVRAIAQTALTAGLDPVLVVTGSRAEEIEAALHGLPVRLVRNEAWQEGQAGSIRAAVKSLAPSILSGAEVGAAIFLLADQPQVNAPILQALVERHRLDLPPALAPLVRDARANPVLFDRVAFPDLLELRGDVGGRGLFHKYPPAYLPWHDERLLLDVDTPEQYRKLNEDESL